MDGRGGLKLIKRLSNSITRVKEFCYRHTVVYALVIAACAALILAVWAASDGESVAFVYNEF